MRYSELADLYRRLEKTTLKTLKTKFVADFLKKTPDELLEIVPYLILGKVFPDWDERELGVGEKLLIKAVSMATGVPEKEIEDSVRDTGDLGESVALAIKKKKQKSFFSQPLTIKRVYDTFVKIAEAQGEGSQDRKMKYLANLFMDAEPEEGKYLARTVLGTMRTGVAEGILRDAIAEAFRVKPELVERAYMLTSDFGYVAKIAKLEGNEGLSKVRIQIGKPIRPMLAQNAASVKDALIEMGGEAAFEIKYDGARVQVHKDGDKVIVYSRRLENVTRSIPEVIEAIKAALKPEKAIVEGELVAVGENGRPRPFQYVLRRFRRKYNIDEMIEKIPLELNLFDVMFVDGESLIETKFIDRRNKLEEIVKESEKIKLAEQLITKKVEEAEAFYRRALELGHEGLMAKRLDSIYEPGNRGKKWLKIKPTMENLDLVIIGAEWGEGRRAHLLGSFLVAAYDPHSGEFLPVGKVGSGFTDEDLVEFTKMLKPYIVRQEGKFVEIEPKFVIEVTYQEIQKSPKYKSGFALRFPRYVALREDKSPEEADTIERVAELYELQERFKAKK
ncbi:ATP-dependent DNA ligase [Thermococcus kodakarensis]|uniref:DNA ligase n=1 Tax=Thermococcus kodakarensis (strain ATCC BAA-918 / JCM 12380 / KOD1) TaxID=69014 RepID=DNLI_THEKO|nr:ATP-dependent DNA ligase [Thermococcus kodakarensis]Q9HHC4.2 RecName: Full=DNA ligase; AltName: Full=Lig(Tk); AltName: Full=Polydeoxyribonucleotide synthase [ATP/NAD(+)] [Thermococcus kodakarensis KOD1]WCN29456.1 ATP-dependent DNA ligase [Thermococcus kodakarensis]WCN31738.1 ATP-dependent DNA ligase [Thermococcus kodakarensis]